MAGYKKIGLPCDIEGGCGSSDAMVINSDDSHHCFSCGKTSGGDNSFTEKPNAIINVGSAVQTGETSISFRSINKEIASKYGVKVGDYTDAYNNVYEGSIFYPVYNNNNEIIGTKVRKRGEKDFAVTGDIKGLLFGQQLFAEGGRYLTIVEGENDALAAHQMNGGLYPVVSVMSASQALSDIKRNIEYVQTFENIILCFDSDEPGKQAADKVAEFIGGSNVKIVTLTKYKDANDYLVAGKRKEFEQEWWNAKQYSPSGVVMLSDAWEFYENRNASKRFLLPPFFNKLNVMLNGGISAGSITTIGALTSIGKTTVVNNIVYGLLQDNKTRVGYFGAETDVGELIESLLSIHTGKNLGNTEITINQEGVHETFKSLEFSKNLAILNHDGSMSTDALMNKTKAMIKMLDLEIFIIDPLQATLPSLDNSVVDDFMDKCLKLVKATNVALILVSHMKKPDKANPHDVSEYDLKGSSAINQVSFNTILLSRDKMAEEENIRHSTKIQLVKARQGKDTGDAGFFRYSQETCRLEETENPYRTEE